jgi:hypothetical protein
MDPKVENMDKELCAETSSRTAVWVGERNRWKWGRVLTWDIRGLLFLHATQTIT